MGVPDAAQEAVRAAQARTVTLEQQLYEAAEHWSLGEAARALTALRGIQRTAAITLLAELDDISRFDNPSELMGLRQPGAERILQWAEAPPRRADEGRQCRCAADVRRVRLGLSFSGVPNKGDPTPFRAGFARRTGDRLESPEETLRPLSTGALCNMTRALCSSRAPEHSVGRLPTTIPSAYHRKFI